MLTKNIENRNQVEFVSLEQMVPKDHLLRQIDAAIDFNKVYEFVEDLYCKDNGRPSIDPVVLFKIVLVEETVDRFTAAFFQIMGNRKLRRPIRNDLSVKYVDIDRTFQIVHPCTQNRVGCELCIEVQRSQK